MNIDFDHCKGDIPRNENVCDNHSFVDRRNIIFHQNSELSAVMMNKNMKLA